MIGWVGQILQTDQTDLIIQAGQEGPTTQTDRGDLMIQTSQAGLTTRTGRWVRWPKQDRQSRWPTQVWRA